MKILVVTPFMPPNIGGIERYSFELAQTLVDLGMEVSILTGVKKGTSFHQLEIPVGILVENVVPIETFNVFAKIPIPKLTKINLKNFKKVFSYNFDLVLIQSHVFPLSYISAHLVKARTKVLINHGAAFFKWNVIFLDRISKLIETFLLKSVSRELNYVYSVSSEGKFWISSILRLESRVLRNSVPTSFMKITKQTNLQFLTTRDLIRILYVGRLVPNKGAHEAIDVFRNVSRVLERSNSQIQIQLDIVGDGPLLKELEANVYPGIVFHGKTPHSQVASLMSRSHLFIYPSTYSEGFPTVLLEAAAMGLAILTTERMPGLGFLFEKGAALGIPINDFQDELLKILNDLDLLNKMRAESKELTIANYEWHSNVSNFLRELGSN